jgi:PTH1 family peptidyl-tRNA hydrolase
MRSVVGHLGTTDFPRVRIGIGERPFGWDLADYVLSHLSGDDGEAVRTAVEQAARAAALIVSDGVDLAMNRMNVRR